MQDYSNLPLSAREMLTFVFGISAIGTGIGILFYDSIIIGIFISAGLSLALPRYKKSISEKHRSELLVQFRDLLYSVAASVSSGRSMTDALREAKEFCAGTYENDDYIMRELDYIVKKIDNGNEVDTVALRDFAKRSRLEDIEDFVGVYENCKGSGANLTEAINRANKLIGDKIELEGELRSLLAQKLFESRIVGAAPFAIVFMIRLTAPEYLEKMSTTNTGMFITTFAVVLIGIAVCMTERIHKIEI